MLRKRTHGENRRSDLKTLSFNAARLCLKQGLLLLGIAAIPAVATAVFDLKWKLPPEFRELKTAEAHSRSTEYTWVDVRTLERFNKAHIPQAVLFDEDNITEGIASLKSVHKPGRKIVVYGEGKGSDRAQRVARIIRKELQSKEVVLLEGGWSTWPRE